MSALCRREFITGVLALAVAPGCAEERAARPFITQVDAVRALGARYLAAQKPPPTLAALVAETLGRSRLPNTLGEVLAAQKTLLEKHHKDLEAHAAVDIDGWALTPTEAKAYAVLHLAFPDPTAVA